MLCRTIFINKNYGNILQSKPKSPHSVLVSMSASDENLLYRTSAVREEYIVGPMLFHGRSKIVGDPQASQLLVLVSGCFNDTAPRIHAYGPS